MGIPTIEGVGAVSSSIAPVTYTLPAHAADDILLLFVECAETVGVTAPSGWAHVTGSPRAQGSNVTSVNIMWQRAAASGTTNPTVADPGDHQVGFAVVLRGVVATGDPWNFTPVGTGAGGATTFSATGGTTTAVDTRAFVVVANNTDSATDQFSSVTNGTLTGFAEVDQAFTASGNGGGVGVWSGTRTTTGSTGTTNGNIAASSSYSALVFALVGASGGAVDLVAADSAHAHTSESATLTQVHELAPVDSAHGHAAESAALTQVHALAPTDSTHAHTADSPTLTQVHAVTPADSAHGHVSESPSLTQAHALSPADSTHSHTVDSPTLTASDSLVPVASVHQHITESPALTQAHVLAPLDSAHGHSAESPSLTQVHILQPADSLHGHASDSPTLSDAVATVTPAERTLTIPTDDRTVAVAVESRTLTIPAENRTL
jgi:hypothetical protein